MKKITALTLTFAFLLSFGGCGNDENKENDISQTPDGTTDHIIEAPIERDPTDAQKEIKSITYNTKDLELPEAEEPFFEDDSYIYVFANPNSRYVLIEYTDGRTEGIEEALNNDHIQITDLDKYSINYFSEPKHIEKIVDLTESGEIGTDDALEGFFRDDRYTYWFSSIKSEYVTVYYKDGSEQNVKVALEDGKIKISDLDWFGVQYHKVPIE
ncbi:MAG: hypothetical protein E7672_08315 [Ruminococcaceae bacterium]|nr:hypothetical protein [Oscillospiraceae bacterium]